MIRSHKGNPLRSPLRKVWTLLPECTIWCKSPGNSYARYFMPCCWRKKFYCNAHLWLEQVLSLALQIEKDVIKITTCYNACIKIEKEVIRITTCHNVCQFSNYHWNSAIYYVHPHKEISSPVQSQQQTLLSGWVKCFAVSILLLFYVKVLILLPYF